MISGPAVEPVSLYDMKLQLGLGPMEDLDQVRSMQLADSIRPFISAAREHLEDYTRTAFITQTWQVTYDDFPWRGSVYGRTGFPEILLPKSPFQSLLSLNYTDPSGSPQTLDLTQGIAVLQISKGGPTQPARINAPYATPWPVIQIIPDAVSLQYVCGYGDTPASVPATIRAAIKMGADHLMNRGVTALDTMPRAVYGLVNPYRNLVS